MTESRNGPESPTHKGTPLRLDPSAASARDDVPAFLARPPGTPVYHGFALVEETRTEGWCFGAISDFLAPDDCDGCLDGDGFVEAPDGSRAGLVWHVGHEGPVEVMPPSGERWGVYAVSFPRPIRSVQDLVDNFHAVLPVLQALYAQARRRQGERER